MKTTIEISDALLKHARELAAREGTTLRALVEVGLQEVIQQRSRRPRFQLRDASFRGNGLQPGFEGAGWDQIRRALYEDRGG